MDKVAHHWRTLIGKLGPSRLEDYRLSRHATERAVDMKVRPEEIRAALLEPEHVNTSPSYPGFFVRCAGRIALPVSTDGLVATVLWRRDVDIDPRFERDNEALDREPEYVQRWKINKEKT